MSIHTNRLSELKYRATVFNTKATWHTNMREMKRKLQTSNESYSTIRNSVYATYRRSEIFIHI